MIVLAVDDDFTQLERIKVQVAGIRYPKVELLTADSLASALAALARHSVDLVLSDYKMEDGTGLDLLRFLKALNPLIPIVIMTAYSDTREAVKLLKAGADDYLIKPLESPDIEKVLIRIHEKNLLIRERYLNIEPQKDKSFRDSGIIYASKAMASVMRMADKVAQSAAPVHISGESGSGKDSLARFIHNESEKKEGPFFIVSAPDIRENGAGRQGQKSLEELLQAAGAGTIYLRDLGGLSAQNQRKLFAAIDAQSEKKSDFPLFVSSSAGELPSLIERNLFMRELFYALSVNSIAIPPLRNRKEDIPPLAEHFLQISADRQRKMVVGFSREAMDMFVRYSFPGNIRELAMLVERALILSSGDHILERDLSGLVEEGDQQVVENMDTSYEAKMGNYERRVIEEALSLNPGNKSAAARELKMSERHLRSRLERLEAAGFSIAKEFLIRKKKSSR